MHSFTELLNEVIARHRTGAIGVANALGVARSQILRWRERDSIPAHRWSDVCDLAVALRVKVSLAEMADWAAARGREGLARSGRYQDRAL